MSPLTWAGISLATISAAYVFGPPLAAHWFSPPARAALYRLPAAPLGEQFILRLMELVIYGWFFMLGASIGSFLNVVIYRLPLGMTLLGSSRCPYCRSSIRVRDNLPVFAWLALRGRCRICRLPISARYPIVEFTVGVVFLVLACLELFGGGANLPSYQESNQSSVSWLVQQQDWSLVLIYAYHCLLISVLLSWSYIRYDRRSLPEMYVVFVMFAGIVMAAIWPKVHPVMSFDLSEVFNFMEDLVQRFSPSVLGLGCGILLGTLWQLALPRRHSSKKPRQLPLWTTVWATIGLFLGWESVFMLALPSAALWLIKCLLSPIVRRFQTVPPLACVSLMVFLFICLWRVVYDWASAVTSEATMFGWLAVPPASAILVAVANRCGHSSGSGTADDI